MVVGWGATVTPPSLFGVPGPETSPVCDAPPLLKAGLHGGGSVLPESEGIRGGSSDSPTLPGPHVHLEGHKWWLHADESPQPRQRVLRALGKEPWLHDPTSLH